MRLNLAVFAYNKFQVQLCNNGLIVFKLRETGYLDLTIIKGTPKYDNVHR